MLLTGSYIRLLDDCTHSRLELWFNEFLTLKASPEGYRHCIELIHPDRCLLFKVDYVYLLANDDKTIQRWYYVLLSVCKPWEKLHTNSTVSIFYRL